jgi:SAM-dependent methyltransferase
VELDAGKITIPAYGSAACYVMDNSFYADEAVLEATHWWYTERRRLFSRLITEMGLPADARILDIGTSTGTNLRMLHDLGFSRYEGLDSSEEAVRWCAEKGYGNVTKGDACKLPFADGTFDLVLATDVIEHVDDDIAALREIGRVLNPGGRALITVPMFGALWGLQDEVSHHKRRYRTRELLARADSAGLRVFKRFYFNYILFVPIFFVRAAIRIFRVKMSSEVQFNNGITNRIMKLIFRLDVATAPYLHPPFGVSYLMLADRKVGA